MIWIFFDPDWHDFCFTIITNGNFWKKYIGERYNYESGHTHLGKKSIPGFWYRKGIYGRRDRKWESGFSVYHPFPGNILTASGGHFDEMEGQCFNLWRDFGVSGESGDRSGDTGSTRDTGECWWGFKGFLPGEYTVLTICNARLERLEKKKASER